MNASNPPSWDHEYNNDPGNHGSSSPTSVLAMYVIMHIYAGFLYMCVCDSQLVVKLIII